MADTNPTPSYKLPVISGSAAAAPKKQGWSRRDFLQMAGATSVAALAAGCRPPHDTVLPYVNKPEDVVPGNAMHYATAMCMNGLAAGLLVTAFDGRPTKIEGNPKHPVNGGAAGVFQQAAHWTLYDPSRARGIRNRKVETSRESFIRALRAKGAELAADNGGAKLQLLLEPSSSQLLASQLAELKARFPNAQVRYHSPSAGDGAAQGAQLAFGQPLQPRYELKNAKVVVSLDADFLVANPDTIKMQSDWAEGRDPEKPMNRLYVAEARMSVTGSNADHRFPMKSGEVAAFAKELAGRVGQKMGNGALSGLASGFRPASVSEKAFAALVNDLTSNPGAAVVLAGERQPAAVHALAHALNEALGGVGKVVSYSAPVLLDPSIGFTTLKAVVDDAANGKIDTLLCTTFDPAYAHPADVDVAGAFAKVPNLIYSSLHEDQTSKLAEWFVPATHPLEAWGDVRAVDGTVTLAQPLIERLYNSFTITEILSALLDPAPLSAHDLLKRWLQKNAKGDFEAFWAKALQTGFLEGSQSDATAAAANFGAVAQAAGSIAAPAAGTELNFATDYKVWDGRFAGIPFLQELPDPITKLTWDNAVYLSANTAKKLGLELEQMVEIKHGGKSVKGPIHVMPGHADDAVTVMLGYGQHLGEDEDELPVGFNAYAVQTAGAPWFDGGAEVRGVDARYPLAITQGHFSQEGRLLANVFDRSEKEEAVKEYLDQVRGPLKSLYDKVGPVASVQEKPETPVYQWAMGVDLSRCTGCNACVIACVAENNVPVVGKTNVRKGREMHWLRIDRYYIEGSGDANPVVVNQPVMCQHCENAPCEYVCPVNATMHSEEGLNEMIYNRCVGTRYCSNNCPYKVRRFNFFNYTGNYSPSEQMQFNPDVTVRARGVMEKCTYCVQRIERGRIAAEIEGRELRDGDVRVACQQACPTDAINFGSLTHADAEVTKRHHDPRRYDLLHSLGARPRTAYLARVTNRHPDIDEPALHATHAEAPAHGSANPTHGTEHH